MCLAALFAGHSVCSRKWTYESAYCFLLERFEVLTKEEVLHKTQYSIVKRKKTSHARTPPSGLSMQVKNGAGEGT